MGCGASKGTTVTTHAPQNAMYPPMYQHQQYKNTSYNNVTSGYNQQVNQYQSFSMTTESPTNGLPPPRPPDQTLEELLAGKEDLLRRSDQHAQGVSFDNAIRQELTEFTDKSLIPKGTVEERESLQIVEDTSPNNTGVDTKITEQTVPSPRKLTTTPRIQPDIATTANGGGSAGTLSSISDFQPTQKDNADAAELLLEKYKRDTEKAKNLMMVDKMRHNITLQDKLAKRKEMKRRAALAQGTVTTGEVSDEIGAKQRRTEWEEQEGVGATVGAEMVGEGAIIREGGEASIGLVDAGAVAETGAGQDQHKAVMAQAAPKPTAPQTRKEAIYGDEHNIELFKDLEDFAINMEQISSPTTTFALLMKSLLIDQLSDLEKVRILFHWITKQDLNSIHFPINISEDTPMGFLLAIKNGTKTYAELFSRLCSAAGLHAKVITGYLKGVGYLPDYKFTGAGDPFRGSWNAVLINGQWRLIDTHWGARHVLENDDAPTIEHETIYRYEEHYFLTNPDQLIVTHFPDERDWQLLQHPISLEQFQDTVKVWPLHYKLKLNLHSHSNGVIVAPSDGTVEIRIKTSDFARYDAEFKCDFMTKTKQRLVGQTSLACCTFHYTENEFQVFRVQCPAAGEYLVKIFGMSQKFSDENVFTNIALYQINCPKLKPPKRNPKDPLNVKPSEIFAPFSESNMPWGPLHMRKQTQILPVSHYGPIISCDKNGEATLIMQIAKIEPLNFLQNLYIADGRAGTAKQALLDRAVHSFTASKDGRNFVVFRIRTPERGNYSLSLYLNTASEGTFEGFCNYFVVSEAQSHPAPPFPSVPNGRLGDNTESCQSMNIRPTAYPKYIHKGDDKFVPDYGNGWIGVDNANEGYVTFEHADPINIIADLEGKDGVQLSGNVIVEDTGRQATVIIRPPKGEADYPEYALKVYAAPAHQSSGIPAVFNGLVVGAHKDPKLFPPSPAKRWGPINSQYGLSVVSISNTTPLFNIDIAKDVQDPSPCRLYKGGDDAVIRLTMKEHLTLKSVPSIDKGGAFQQVDDDSSFFSEISPSEAILHLRFSATGDYCFSLYGSEASSGGNQLSPLLHMLFHVTSVTKGSGFPRSFGIWSTGIAKLHYPMSKYLKRNAVNKIKVTLADVSHETAQAYPGVLLLTEQSQSVSPTATDVYTSTYEWDYVPGPGERVLSLVAQKTPGDSSLSYVLQFEVLD